MSIKNVVCRNCLTVNRVPETRLGDGPKCGRCKQPLFRGVPADLTTQSFQKFIQKNDLPVLVDFWAPWCGPCRMMAPEFSAAAAQLEPRMLLAKLDTQAHPQPAAPYNITGIPTMILFHRGREIARTSGAMDANQIIQWANNALPHSMAS